MVKTSQPQAGSTVKAGVPRNLKHVHDTGKTATKSERVTILLQRAKGASIAEIMTATGLAALQCPGFYVRNDRQAERADDCE